MSVRRERRRDPKTGAVREFYIVDIDLQHPDGRRERVRKVPPVQTRRAAEQFERELRKALLDGTHGRKTVNNHLSCLHKMLDVAAEWRIIPFVPRVKWLRVPEAAFDFLTFEEAERRVAAADPEWRAMITVGLKAGLWLGELLGLQWDDVDLVAGRLVVWRAVSRGRLSTPKSGRKREIAIGQIAIRALKEHRHLRGNFVFCDMDGEILKKNSCKWPLWRACKRAGLRRIGWHVLRHTFASHLVMRGAPLKAIQELLGHSDIRVTMRYAHLLPQ